MTFGPKRGHIAYIFENFIKDFGLLIGAIIVGLVIGNMDAVLENAVVLVIVLLGPVGRVIQYFTTTYEADEEKLVVREGLFTKKVREVPLSTITTVDFSQNIFHQLFSAYRVNVDNAGTLSSDENKVGMTLSKADAEEIRRLLMAGRSGLDGFNLGDIAEEEQRADSDAEKAPYGKVYRTTKGQLLLMGALKSKIVFFAQLFALTVGAAAFFNLDETIVSLIIVDGIKSLGAGVFLLIVGVLCFLLAIVAGMVGTLVRYYGFQAVDNGEAVKIEYGLLTRKTYTIQKNRISGFAYGQTIFMRFAHMGTLSLYAIGYGNSVDEDDIEEPMLFPLLKEDQLKTVITELAPEMGTAESLTRAQKGSLHYFFYGTGFIIAAIFFGASVYLSMTVAYCGQLWLIGLLMMIYSVVGRILEYRHNAVHSDSSHYTMISGGFTKNTEFVKTSHIESVSLSLTPRKKKKHIGHVVVGFIAPAGVNAQKIKNVNLDAYTLARNKMIY